MNGRIAIRDWLPAIGALCAVIAAVGYALTRGVEVSDEIRNMDDLANTLTARAQDAQEGVRSKEEIAALSGKRKELELRMVDSQKPGLVVSQLSEAARAAGLLVVEIQPLATPSGPDQSVPRFPNYRVSLKGGYQQIAKYMDDCAGQRIPVRVAGLDLGRFSVSETDTDGEELRADIVVEAYQCRDRVTETKQGA